jgi:hypothetical protein
MLTRINEKEHKVKSSLKAIENRPSAERVKETQDMQKYIIEYKELRETQERIFGHPEIKKLMKDKKLKSTTLLSKFTILENNFSGLTSSHLLNQDEKPGSDVGLGGTKAEMQELLQATTHSIREALFHLSKLIDTGDFHTELIVNTPVRIELHPSIPKCFKVKLSDFTAPLQISIGYTSGSKGRANDDAGQAELLMNQARR